MPCGGCGKRKLASDGGVNENDITGGYANLTDRQLKSRLEVYKKRFCATCPKRYECDYKSYLECKKSEVNKVTT